MSKDYVTISGDTVDGILFRQLGRNDDETEAGFWLLNPDASLKTVNGTHFPKGVVLHLPAVKAEEVRVVSPWD
jgi:phage tail protein X